MVLAFLVCLCVTKVPRKGLFFLRAMGALIVAVLLAHVNRIFGFWPEHLLFPSGHTTFCLGLAFSIAVLRPWTLTVTLPSVAILGYCLVALHCHSTEDILGAIPLAMTVYGLVHWMWPLSAATWPKSGWVAQGHVPGPPNGAIGNDGVFPVTD